MAQDNLGNDAGCYGDEGIVRTDLNPVVSARGRAQPMGPPVVDDVLVATIVGRKPVAPVKAPVRSGAPTWPVGPMGSRPLAGLRVRWRPGPGGVGRCGAMG